MKLVLLTCAAATLGSASARSSARVAEIAANCCGWLMAKARVSSSVLKYQMPSQ